MKKHGPIIFLKFPKNNEVLVGSQELVHELCDQERFEKKVGGALEEVRTVGGDGECIVTDQIQWYSLTMKGFSRHTSTSRTGR